MRALVHVLRWALWLLTRPFVYIGLGLYATLFSFRFWVLLILAVLILLIA